MAWIMKYAHDANGKPGPCDSIDELCRFVEDGAPVRVAYIPDWSDDLEVDRDNPPYRKLIMDVDPVFSRRGVVMGQAEWKAVDAPPPPNDALIFTVASLDDIVNLSTSGTVWRRRVDANGQLPALDQQSNWAMEWYVEV